MMEFLATYWAVIVSLICVVIAVGLTVREFWALPTSAQLAAVQEWLLWAVTQAEAELGSGTGALKLRYVYDLFVTAFPWVASYVAFEDFSVMVDKALEEMRELLESNESVKTLVEGESA